MYGCLDAPPNGDRASWKRYGRSHSALLGFNQQCPPAEPTASPHTAPRRSTPSSPSARLTLAQLARRASPATSTQRWPAALEKHAPASPLQSGRAKSSSAPPNRLVGSLTKLPVTQCQSGWWINYSVCWESRHGGASGLLSRSQSWSETGGADESDGVKSGRASPHTGSTCSASALIRRFSLSHW